MAATRFCSPAHNVTAIGFAVAIDDVTSSEGRVPTDRKHQTATFDQRGDPLLSGSRWQRESDRAATSGDDASGRPLPRGPADRPDS